MLFGGQDQILMIFFGGPYEILIILAIVLLLFGKRIPSVMRSLGSSIVEFKKGVNDIEEEVKKDESDKI